MFYLNLNHTSQSSLYYGSLMLVWPPVCLWRVFNPWSSVCNCCDSNRADEPDSLTNRDLATALFPFKLIHDQLCWPNSLSLSV